MLVPFDCDQIVTVCADAAMESNVAAWLWLEDTNIQSLQRFKPPHLASLHFAQLCQTPAFKTDQPTSILLLQAYQPTNPTPPSTLYLSTPSNQKSAMFSP